MLKKINTLTHKQKKVSKAQLKIFWTNLIINEGLVGSCLNHHILKRTSSTLFPITSTHLSISLLVRSALTAIRMLKHKNDKFAMLLKLFARFCQTLGEAKTFHRQCKLQWLLLHLSPRPKKCNNLIYVRNNSYYQSSKISN